MLNKILAFFKGLGTKTLIILIALSFALWGVGDIFTNNNNPVIAKVGNNKIKLNEFNLEYQSILQNLRASSNENLTDEFVKAMGLQNTVLDNLITQKYLNIISQDLGIIISDKYLKRSILNNPLFKDQLGVFNKDYFNYYLNQNNLSEKELLEISKKILLNDLLVKSLNSASDAPQTMTNNFLKKINIARKAEIYYFDGSAILIKDKITDELLLNKYKKVKNNFLTPESRSFTLIKIDRDEIKKSVNITSKQIEEVYKVNKDAYQLREARETYQPIFKTKEKAEDFLKDVKNNSFFDALIKNNIKKEDIYLGEVYKEDFDKKTDGIIFSLQEKEMSNIQKDSFGYKLYYIKKIKTPTPLTSQEIMDKIKDDLTREEMFKLTYKLADKIFEDFLETKDIDKAIPAKNIIKHNFIKMTLNDIEDIYSKTKISLPSEELSKYIFNTNENEISDLIEDKDDNFYFIHINNIALPAVQKFEEVREKIVNIIYDEKKSEMAKMEAENFLLNPSKIKKNKLKSNFQFVETNFITVENNKEKFSSIIKDAIFKTKIDSYSSIINIEKNKYAVIKPTKQKITNLSDDKKYIDSIQINLKNSINNDLIEAMLYDLKSKVKKSINKNFLNSF